jgi:hypothetical protein
LFQDILGCKNFRKQGLQNVEELIFNKKIHKMMHSIVRHKKMVARMVAPMEVKKLRPSMQMARDCQDLLKTKARNLKQVQCFTKRREIFY